MMHVGLTGGIGSGKSTVAQLLCERGAVLIDADIISRQCTQAGGAGIEAIQNEFGAEFIDKQGAIDRARMRVLVFSDPSARLRLEGIIHPLVSTETQRQAQHASQNGARCVVFDVPLLVESKRWRQQVDLVLVVDCSAETQLKRTMLRSQLSENTVQQIMFSQTSRQDRLKAADLVIFNDLISRQTLHAEVQQISPRFGL